MLSKIVIIFRITKFSHSVFALPFAIMTFCFWPSFPGWGRLGLIVWCMIWARSTVMTFNRIADAKLDARNPRRSTRHKTRLPVLIYISAILCCKIVFKLEVIYPITCIGVYDAGFYR